MEHANYKDIYLNVKHLAPKMSPSQNVTPFHRHSAEIITTII